MKSICIKITNNETSEYLLEKLNNFKLNDTYFSFRKFKIYPNIIIHYLGEDINSFIKELSFIISSLILDIYEETLIKKIIKSEYFYFNTSEQNQIVESSLEDLNNKEEYITPPKKRLEVIQTSIYNYLSNNHSIVLQGFITFRLRKYFNILLEQIDKSVNKYIVQKEYTEFINILKTYISSEPSSCNIIHLIYHNFNPILLNENKEIIEINKDIFNTKYLSDISFSTNDYTLNTLLNLIPKKIYIHLIDNNCDDFINTLKLIFENRIILCTDCSICNVYNKSKIANPFSK